MSRRLIVTLLAVLLLLPTLGSAAAGAEGAPTITLTGKLEYVVTEAPHYEVDGYVLISDQLTSLKAASGQYVRVVGIEYTGPSIFMRKALEVSEITLLGVTPPGQISVRLRGKLVFMDQPPVVRNNRTLVGLRAIATALGADVAWDQATQTAIVTRDGHEVRVTLGSNRVTVREPGQPEQVIIADVTPIAAGGRMLVPVRVLSESLGLTVGWENDTRTVVLE